jgi:drug/metabolite transporter (DMT)-like permease
MPYLLIFTAIIFWASDFVGIRAALPDYTPLELAVFRLIVASVALFIFMLLGKIRLPKKRSHSCVLPGLCVCYKYACFKHWRTHNSSK